MKKSDSKKFAQRVKDAIEEELVACGFDRNVAKDYLKISQINFLWLEDLIEVQKDQNKLKK